MFLRVDARSQGWGLQNLDLTVVLTTPSMAGRVQLPIPGPRGMNAKKLMLLNCGVGEDS